MKYEEGIANILHAKKSYGSLKKSIEIVNHGHYKKLDTEKN